VLVTSGSSVPHAPHGLLPLPEVGRTDPRVRIGIQRSPIIMRPATRVVKGRVAVCRTEEKALLQIRINQLKRLTVLIFQKEFSR
jgi:hypothetical protein